MGDLPATNRDRLRASDDDRTLVMSLLSDALGTGRISFAEYEQRSHGAVEARTYGDLDRLVADLPLAGPAPAPAARGHVALPMLTTKVAVMSEAKVRGPIAVGAGHSVVAFWGGADIDLSEATFTAPEVTITAVAIMGGIKIVLPAAATVHVPGVGVMGAFSHKNPGLGDPAGPRITVRGIAFWGGVDVIQK
ncbi:DUF1707 SHOCT-like domain-containing protein [Tsukamurella soli]|uniref:DUF1707 domain-containing protein n=1 Tax=Tsukamurella soli TaxID=644556 RepID=A0ABP8JP88_9ACTN